MRKHVCVVIRLRLDANLFAFPPPRRKRRGRPPIKGQRLKKLSAILNDPKVSSFHARIDRSSDGFVLVDLKSRNGSFVNGKRITQSVLKTGDEVRLGTARLLYKVDYTSSVHAPV